VSSYTSHVHVFGGVALEGLSKSSSFLLFSPTYLPCL